MRNLILLLILICQSSEAQVYKWTDEFGRAQFSNRVDPETENAEKVDVSISSAIPVRQFLQANSFIQKGASPTLGLSPVTLNIDGNNPHIARVGSKICGDRIYPIEWEIGDLPSKFSKPFSEAIEGTFRGHDYDMKRIYAGWDSINRYDFQVSAEIIDLKVNWCKKPYNRLETYSKKNRYSKASSYIKIKWTLRDVAKRTNLVTVISEGSYDGLKKPKAPNGLSFSVSKSMEMASHNLLAHLEFTDFVNRFLTGGENNNASNLKDNVSRFSDSISIELDFSHSAGEFSKLSNSLKGNTIKVHGELNIGLGIIINSQGYVLTNATTVGANDYVDVFHLNKAYKAQVIRVEPNLNIALLKVSDILYGINGIHVNISQTFEGDNIYFTLPMATQQDSETLMSFLPKANTKSGLSYFKVPLQMSNNNLGGPVFNGFGELFAITVPGASPMDSQPGNSYHLVGIKDALAALNIAEGPDFSPLIFGNNGTSFLENMNILTNRVKDWFNKPIMSLN